MRSLIAGTNWSQLGMAGESRQGKALLDKQSISTGQNSDRDDLFRPKMLKQAEF